MKTIKQKLICLLSLVSCVAVHAETITPKVHAFSSQNPVAGRDATNSVDGKGLYNGNHLASDSSNWTTVGVMGKRDFAPYIIYDLRLAQDVRVMHIWNYNSAIPLFKPGGELSTQHRKSTVLGADKVEVFTSVDGKKFTSQGVMHFDIATGNNEYKGQKIKVNYRGVRYIKFQIKSTHEGTIFDGTGKKNGEYDKRALTGFSEVRFETPDLVEYRYDKKKLTVAEGGAGTSYQLRLSKKPKKDEVISVLAVPNNKSLLLGESKRGMAMTINFNDKNWNQWKTVKIRAYDDAIFTTQNDVSINHFFSRGKKNQSIGALGEKTSVRIVENDTDTIEILKPIDPAKRMEWFRSLKYYWFICWVPSSIGGGEISFSRSIYGVEKYDAFPKQFKAKDFNAEEWVRIAKAGGLKTIVFITKHHDGFCMWDSKVTDYDVMNTPFGRDVVKELSEACKKYGLRLSLYYSIPDWHHPDWPAPGYGGPGFKLDPKDYGKDTYEYAPSSGARASQLPPKQRPNIRRYMKYTKAHIKELLTNYGDIGLMWWDGANPAAFGNFWAENNCALGWEIEKFVRKLQPAMVQNNRAGYWKNGWFVDEFGDYDSSEISQGAFNTKDPWEYTWTLGHQWSWRPNDVYKSKKDLLRNYLIRIVGRDGNFLMDVSPDSSGKFEPHVVKRLTDIGNWLKLHGESIYSTRGGPYKPGKSNWGVSTRKENKVYLHILNWNNGGKLTLPSLGKRIKKSSLLTGGSLKIEQANANAPITIEVPTEYQKEIDTIIVLELEGDAMGIQPIHTK